MSVYVRGRGVRVPGSLPPLVRVGFGGGCRRGPREAGRQQPRGRTHRAELLGSVLHAPGSGGCTGCSPASPACAATAPRLRSARPGPAPAPGTPARSQSRPSAPPRPPGAGAARSWMRDPGPEPNPITSLPCCPLCHPPGGVPLLPQRALGMEHPSPQTLSPALPTCYPDLWLYRETTHPCPTLQLALPRAARRKDQLSPAAHVPNLQPYFLSTILGGSPCGGVLVVMRGTG